MPPAERARLAALSILAAVAGTAAAGLAALAQAGAGLCDRRLFVHHHGALPHAEMAMPAPPPATGGVCPILVYAALVAAALCTLALLAWLACRARPGVVAAATARLVLRLRLGRLTALLGLAGGLPLAAIAAADAGAQLAGPAAVAALVVLAGGALLGALALVGAARTVVALARRLAGALAAAFRLLAPGSDARWARQRRRVPLLAGVRLARRRPARAPPVGF